MAVLVFLFNFVPVYQHATMGTSMHTGHTVRAMRTGYRFLIFQRYVLCRADSGANTAADTMGRINGIALSFSAAASLFATLYEFPVPEK